MKTEDDVRSLEKLIVQLRGMHTEISQLAKRSPNDGLNVFKLRLVNKVLAGGNELLTGRYKPFEDFGEFDEEALPTNSDVTMILALYMEQTERLRSDNMVYSEYKYKWYFVIDGATSQIEGAAPTTIGKDKK